jgi:microcystin-dependent protein
MLLILNQTKMKKTIIMLSIMITLFHFNEIKAQEPYIGEIRLVGFNFAPVGWAFCDGQLLPIQQYQALFSLFGITYGGDGQTTFALPDLRGRVPMGQGTGSGLTSRSIGEQGGAENNTLLINQLPPHSHSVNAVSTDGNQNVPSGSLPANTKTLDKEYSNAASDTTMNQSMIGNTGGGQPVNNMQPYLIMNYIIALQGIYPSRN